MSRATYTDQNVVLTATHTRSGPGGFDEHTLYNLTTLGFEAPVFEAIVAGIVRSVDAAHAGLAPGTVKIAEGTLSGANVNRSIEPCNASPAVDRARFPGAVDPRMPVLRFEQAGRPIGRLSFFATHGTSMTQHNHLISADNKGYAAHLLEAGRGDFVAAFAQTAAGDMSPNLRNGGAQGPTGDEFENTRIIGRVQAGQAKELSGPAGRPRTSSWAPAARTRRGPRRSCRCRCCGSARLRSRRRRGSSPSSPVSGPGCGGRPARRSGDAPHPDRLRQRVRGLRSAVR